MPAGLPAGTFAPSSTALAGLDQTMQEICICRDPGNTRMPLKQRGKKLFGFGEVVGRADQFQDDFVLLDALTLLAFYTGPEHLTSL